VSITAPGRPGVGRVPDAVVRFHRRHPEWPVLLLAGAGWAVLVRLHLTTPPAAGVGHHGGPGAHPGPATTTAGPALLADWCVMVTAMMVPTAAPALRRVAVNSLRRRRHRAMAVFLAGYLALWFAFGLGAVAVLLALDAVLPPAVDRGLVPAALLLVAAGYELTSRKRRFLRACHLPFALPPTGRRADAACARFGVRHAGACLGSCGALMLAMSAAGHRGLLLVVIVTAVVTAQKLLVAGTRLGLPVAATLVVAALAVA
jgi:predicted metal-binding membrane protein